MSAASLGHEKAGGSDMEHPVQETKWHPFRMSSVAQDPALCFLFSLGCTFCTEKIFIIFCYGVSDDILLLIIFLVIFSHGKK